MMSSRCVPTLNTIPFLPAEIFVDKYLYSVEISKRRHRTRLTVWEGGSEFLFCCKGHTASPSKFFWYVEAATHRVLDSQRMLEVLMREGIILAAPADGIGDWSGAATNETPFASN